MPSRWMERGNGLQGSGEMDRRLNHGRPGPYIGPIQPFERFSLKTGRGVRSIPRMDYRAAFPVLLAAALAAPACKGRFLGPSKDDVTAELIKEAETFKAKGEQSNPVLRLRSTWNICAGVDGTTICML